MWRLNGPYRAGGNFCHSNPGLAASAATTWADRDGLSGLSNVNESLTSLVNRLASDTALSLPAFRTELALCATIVLMLLVRTIRGGRNIDGFVIALAGSLAAFCLALPWTQPESLTSGGHIARHEIFTGMLV